MKRLSVWLPWSSLGTLKFIFNVSSDEQDSRPDDFYVSVIARVVTDFMKSIEAV